MLTRRHFLKQSLGASIACMTLPACSKKNPPNIIYIMADDLGYADLGCYGQKHIKTPNIDKLAAEGVQFTQHYAGSSVCAPSRCVLMTGLHTGHAHVRGNAEADPYGQMQLPSGTTTVATLLKSAGYKTGAFGKWGMGVENTPGDPQKHGFDEFYGYYCQVHAHNSFPEYLYQNGEKVMLKNKVTYLPKEHWTRGLGGYATEKNEYSNDLIFDAALNFIDKNQHESFFCYLPVTMPHNNGEGPEGEKMEAPTLYGYRDQKWKGDDKRYAAMITCLDEYVGTLVARLDEYGIEQNTIIFFTSDNGGVSYTAFKSNGDLRGAKRDLYEGGIRVPLIVHWPEKITAGSTTEHISAFWDFLPTACDVAGISAPPQTDGISYLPVMLHQTQKQHDYLYWEFYWWNSPYVAVRMRQWKGLYYFKEHASGRFELFNLDVDPREQNECSAQYPDIAEQVFEIMKKEHTPSRHFHMPAFKN